MPFYALFNSTAMQTDVLGHHYYYMGSCIKNGEDLTNLLNNITNGEDSSALGGCSILHICYGIEDVITHRFNIISGIKFTGPELLFCINLNKKENMIKQIQLKIIKLENMMARFNSSNQKECEDKYQMLLKLAR